MGSATSLVVVLYLVQKAWCMVFGYQAILLTGWIGTPIHELSHAFFCVIFGHKIEKISLFSPEPETGVLGYVFHSYNPESLFQRVGCLFIGFAPLAGNGLLAYFLWDEFFVSGAENWALLCKIFVFYVIFSLIIHCAPSPADLKGAVTGAVALAIIIVPMGIVFDEESRAILSSCADSIMNYVF
jgi:hypothetical protein